MVTSLNIMFCPINSPKSKDIEFTITCNTEKLKILTLEKLQPGSVKKVDTDCWIFHEKMDQFLFPHRNGTPVSSLCSVLE